MVASIVARARCARYDCQQCRYIVACRRTHTHKCKLTPTIVLYAAPRIYEARTALSLSSEYSKPLNAPNVLFNELMQVYIHTIAYIAPPKFTFRRQKHCFFFLESKLSRDIDIVRLFRRLLIITRACAFRLPLVEFFYLRAVRWRSSLSLCFVPRAIVLGDIDWISPMALTKVYTTIYCIYTSYPREETTLPPPPPPILLWGRWEYTASFFSFLSFFFLFFILSPGS